MLASILVPEPTDVVNLVANPSGEYATTGYTGITNTPTRSAAQQRCGAYSISYPMASGVNDGLYYGVVSLVNGSPYTMSVWFRGTAGVPYRVYFGSTGGSVLGTPTTFVGTGAWQRVSVTYTETSTTTRRLYFTKNNSADTGTIYVDGLLCWAGSYDLVYWDGDKRGYRPDDFYWLGAPHASQSVMRAYARSGGRVVDLSTYGLIIRNIIGAGLAGIANLITPTPMVGGGTWQGQVAEPRTIALVGTMVGANKQAFEQNKQSIINLVAPDSAPRRQPATLRIQGSDSGIAYGDALDIPVTYAGGLEGGETIGLLAEKVALKFELYLPYLATEDGQQGAALNIQTTVADSYFLQNLKGVWSDPFGANGYPTCFALGPDGSLYVGGNFTVLGGVTVNRIAKIDLATGTVTALGTGADGAVQAIAVAPDGTVYVTGLFANLGGSPAAKIGYFDGAWHAMGTGLTAASGTPQGNALLFAPDGKLYVAGWFDTAGGVAAANVASYSGGTFSAMGAGFAGTQMYSLAWGPDAKVYAGGNAANGVYVYSGTAWSALQAATCNGTIFSLVFTPAGDLLVGGSYTTIGGNSIVAASKWNGSGYIQLGRGLSGTGGVQSIIPYGTSYIFAGNNPNADGRVMASKGLAVWNGSAWVNLDVVLHTGGVTYVTAGIYDPRRDLLMIGISTNGTDTVSQLSTLTNAGTHDAYPTVRITGPGQVYSLINYTTGERIYFDLSLLAGETAFLDLTPTQIKFWSNYRADLSSAILPGSQLSTWHLARGANSVSLFVGAGTTGASSAAAYWSNLHWAYEGGS